MVAVMKKQEFHHVTPLCETGLVRSCSAIANKFQLKVSTCNSDFNATSLLVGLALHIFWDHLFPSTSLIHVLSLVLCHQPLLVFYKQIYPKNVRKDQIHVSKKFVFWFITYCKCIYLHHYRCLQKLPTVKLGKLFNFVGKFSRGRWFLGE